MNTILKLGMAALLSVTMVACSSTDSDTAGSDTGNNTAESNTGNNGAGGPGDGIGVGPNAGLTEAEIRERDTAIAQTVFYFEFDRSDLSAEDREALVHHANRLRDNPNMRIRLEGHADERGTREYNLALGERRAQAIERYLQVQGVSANQMETISYGEESPIATGTTEASYSRNRRVEIQ